MNPSHCETPMRRLPYGEFHFFTCEAKTHYQDRVLHCGQTVMFCPCEKQMIKVNGIYECPSCGKKETYCKNPIFSFNGVYDSDCGDCPGDNK